MKTFLQGFVALLLAAPACAWVVEHHQQLLTYSAATYDWYKTRTSGVAAPALREWTPDPGLSDAPAALVASTPLSASFLPNFGVSLGAPIASSPSSSFGASGNFEDSVMPGDVSSRPAVVSSLQSAAASSLEETLFPMNPEEVVRAVDEAGFLVAQGPRVAGSMYQPPATMMLEGDATPQILNTANLQQKGDASGNAPAGQASVRWYRGANSPDKRPFEYHLIGKGSYKVMVIGSLYGDETSSALFMDRLLYNLNKNLKPEDDLQVLLIRSGNPDGLNYGKATNLAGVLIDQDFPVSNPMPAGQQSVAKPVARQPETTVLMQYVTQFQPVRVLQVRTTRNARGLMEFGTHQESIAALVLQKGDYVIESLEDKIKPGSLASFVVSNPECRYATLYLPLGNFNVDDAWMAHRGMVLGALKTMKLEGLSGLKEKLNQQPVNLLKPEGIPVSRERDLTEAADEAIPFGMSFEMQPSDPLHVQDHVELLPTPPMYGGSNVDTTGYIELPPPPGM